MKKDLLNKLESFDFGEETPVDSVGNLIIYVIDSLFKIGVEPTFPYVCVAANRIFPNIFSLDNEFSEIPDARKIQSALDGLKNELTPTGSKSYRLSLAGKDIARNVSAKLIKKRTHRTETSHKQIGTGEVSKNYSAIQLSKSYSTYLLEKKINLDLIWKHFEIMPNSQIKELKMFFIEVNTYANSIGDKTMILFTEEVISQLHENI